MNQRPDPIRPRQKQRELSFPGFTGSDSNGQQGQDTGWLVRAISVRATGVVVPTPF